MKNLIPLLSLGALLATGCGTDPETAKRLTELENQVKEMEEKMAKQGGPAGRAAAAPQANAEDEKAAAGMLKEINGYMEAMDYDKVKSSIAQLKDKYPDTRAARAVKRIEDEVAVIGKDAGEIQVEKWFQGDVSLADGDATLLVFWEVWCPHCKREVPKIEATYQKYKGDGLNIVGLTKMTRNISEEQITSFLAENKVSYPVAKEEGMAMSQHYGVKGIPAAAVVKDGKIVWRGHPARINDEMIQGWIN